MTAKATTKAFILLVNALQLSDFSPYMRILGVF